MFYLSGDEPHTIAGLPSNLTDKCDGLMKQLSADRSPVRILSSGCCMNVFHVYSPNEMFTCRIGLFKY